MKKFLSFCLLLSAVVFVLSCGETNSKVTTTTVVNDDDSDADDADVTDTESEDSEDAESDEDSDSGDTVDDTSDTTPVDDGDAEDSGKKQGELYGRCYPNKTCNEGLVCDEENDTCIKEQKDDSEPADDSDSAPDNDTSDTGTTDNDTPETPDNDSVIEGTASHKISGTYQIGGSVSGIEAALYECGKTDKIASGNTDAKGKFSFTAAVSAEKSYCVKANGFASCFKGQSDHVANISEITNAVLLADTACSDLRKSETKIRTYAKLGTGEWLGELDYTKLSGISEGMKLLSTYIASTDSKTLSEKIAADAVKENPEFAKFFNGFRVFSDKKEIIIGESADSNANFGVEGGSSKVAPNFNIVWTLKNKSGNGASYKFTATTPGEYTVRAKLTSGSGDPIMLSDDSATVLFLQRKGGGTVYLDSRSDKNISFRIDDGIYGVIPKNTVVKKNGRILTSITYDILTAGGGQISRLLFGPEGAEFTGDKMYFVYELGTVYGGDPKVLSVTRTNTDGTVDVLQSASGDPIMLAASGDPIMTTASGDPIMLAASGDPIMTSASGDPIMTAASGDPIMTNASGDPIMSTASGDPIMTAASGDPIMTAASGDPIMNAASGDPIMMGTSSSVTVTQTNHYSTFTLESASLPVSVEELMKRWCDGSFYDGYSPIEFIKEGVKANKPGSTLLPYLTCEKFGDLGNDLYELMNKQIGFQRNLNLFENLFFVSEFYKRSLARQGNGAVAAVRNGLELRSAIAALYTATTSYNRSTTLADMFDPSMIPLTYSGVVPEDYSVSAKKTLTGITNASDKYAATKKEMMIFANYITTSSKGPNFSGVESVLTPDQLVCAWFDSSTLAQNCNKVYSLNEAGHVTLGGSELSAAEAEGIFRKYLMPMNSRLSNEEKLNLFRTFYLALKYAGTIFFNGTGVEELNEQLLKTAYLVFDGIDGNAHAVSIVDTFDASAHTVSVLDGTDMVTRPYVQKLSALTDKISLKVAAESADVEKVLINIEGKEFEKVNDNTRTYYKPAGDLKEKSIVLTPGTLNNGEKALRELLGSENVDELGNITGKMTIVANSKISGKTYSTQKTYEFFANDDSDGVESRPVPANLEVALYDSETGAEIPDSANPFIILNPGNRVYYPVNGVVSITELTPASYTIEAFADGYFAKNSGVNVPAGATLGVGIMLDKEVTVSADAELELSIGINSLKHPSKVYVQIYNEDMDLVVNESAKFDKNSTEDSMKYETLNIAINSGRYTLLVVGEELYNYLETITVYPDGNTKEIMVVAKNACGNGIIDSAEDCEPAVLGSDVEVKCSDIYPASPNPDKKPACNKQTCVYDKRECGEIAHAICGDGKIDSGEGCDGGAKACAEIAGFGNSTGSAPCATNCIDWETAGNCRRTTESCGNLPANAQWNDGEGTFEQTHAGGNNWTPSSKEMKYGTTKDECVFSCTKGYKWNGTFCIDAPLSLGLICTGAKSCFDNNDEGECPAYGEAFFGQDAQYMETGFCTPHDFAEEGSGDKKIVKDKYTHYEWTAAASENAMSWSEAVEHCSDVNNIISGSTAVWRLPSPAELLTIVDSGTASPALVEKFTTYGHTFWADEDKRESDSAWRIDERGALASVAKTENHHVLCVRVHEYTPVENRFTAENETVKDNESGLMWQKQPVASRTWAEALSYCEEVSTADKFDWRLPNRNELASLINYEKENGAMSDFPSIAEKGFWTSTSSVAGNGAWTVDFETGKIESTGKTNTRYIICVRNDEPCLGGECADPCSFNACKGMANSTGLCTANDYSFTCGCKSGFNWNHGKCLLDTTRYIACEGLPENAVWNSVFGISQSLDGEEWYPSNIGSFNKIASTTECRFICATNYSWDADEEKCLPKSRVAPCGDKTPYSDWNVVSKISQTWNGEAWEPSSKPEYNGTPSEDECRFVCKEHYTWDEENEICKGETRENEPCTGLPANAHWWNDPATITQTWTNSSWAPASAGRYNDSQADNECFFGCNENYEWKDTSCVAKSHNVNCDGLPDNAEWTGNYSSIKQTWNGSEWVPGTIGTYNTESNSNYCRYKCKENYNWNGASCVAATQVSPCTGLPANAQWNTVSSITQTYMEIGENTYDWSPSNVGSYSSDETLAECHFICRENYEWINNECTGRKQIVECAGLPANAAWKDGHSAVEQTWSGSQGWLPVAIGQHNAATGCSFECNTNYTWNASTRTCDGAKRTNQQCIGKPDNANWVGNSAIEQTWNGSDWLPALNGTYSENAVANECHFKCKNNYNWTGSICEAATQIVTCGTLPANAAWNMVSQIKQTWNGNTWEPAVNLEHNDASSETDCRYTCRENYEWKNNQCTAKKQTVACQGLPANAVWNSATVEQTWDSTKWTPDTTGTHTTGNATDKCYFKCIDENELYVWNDSDKSCVGRTKTGQNCTGLKEHAHWNEYSQISQTWNGSEWFPQTVGSYSAASDKDKCYFVCDDNYQWNGSECVASKQIVSCGTLPANAQWNTVSSIEQTWTQKEDGTYGWQPDSTPTYGNASTEECRYTCKANFKWENSQCVPKEQDDQNCIGLPANAEWWNGVTSVKQHWDEVEHAWLPTTTGIHATSGADNQCRFRCIDEGNKYKWENNACVANTKTGQSCTGIPAHAHWNGQYSQISQTWNGSEWFPSTTGTYSTATDETRCYFSCDENYQWNGSECVAKTQIANCGTLPSHAVWNTVSKIKQTWNGSEWSPSATPEHNDLPSEDFCRYTCKENYKWENGACVAETKTAACTGLPANAAWNGSGSVEQSWSGSSWAPAANGVHGDETEGCYFKCIDENDKYEWKNNACAAMTKTGQACTGKPEHSHWNGQYNQISQTWSGEAWLPSTTGSYSTTTDSKKCYFSCDDNYTWNGTECVAAKRIRECSGLAANAQWNTVSSIEQTYQGGSEWLPSNAGTYGAATTTECHYKCNDNYEWKENPENSAVMGCFGKTQTAVECIGLPANAKWLDGHSTVDQTWNGTQGWLPAAIGRHSSVSTDGCVFECDTNYEWKNGACAGVTRTEQPCTGLADDPANNASWNSASAISQTWNGTEWLPTTVGTYNETTSTTQCRFKCNDNYEWNGSACVGATKLADCEGKPEHSIWNTVSRITQTYNGSEYAPATKAEHCNSTTNCCFECLENYTYHYDETTETATCDAATRVKECTGLPANAVWRTSAETTGDSLSITQRWNGSDWEQPATGVHGSYIEGYCRFACKDEGTHYRYEESDNSCVAMTRTGQNCIDKPDNSHWNEYTQIMQTYSGDGDIWLPTTTGSYSATPDKDRCYFVCDDNYEWNGTSCAGATKTSACEGLPKNAAWNVVSSITQTYNGTDYTPSATAEYCENASTTNCCFKCLVNHTISSDQKSCNPDTRVRNCTALPDNAQWNTGASEGKITQTWNGSEWAPELTAVYGETPDPEKCVFKCKENYEPKNGLCVAKKEIALCTGLPANAMWNEVASIVREWQGSAWDLSTKGEYSEDPSKTECRFKCKENFTWDGSKCNAKTRIMDCEERPANSVWNEAASITQTWNGKEWLPKLKPEYSYSPSSTKCKYMCDEGYYHVNGKCVENPCNIDGVNPCNGVEHSTGVCEQIDTPILPYSCECQPGYHWWGKTGCRAKAVTLGNVCTGQNRCYDDETEIPCPSEGDLFYGQDAQYADMGYCAPHNFALKETIVGAETHKTVIDKNTGLEWLSAPESPKNWGDAVSRCNNLNYAGHGGWRLPSIKELLTLIGYREYKMPEGFVDGGYWWYYAWSSTNDGADPDNKALYIGVKSGFVDHSNKGETQYFLCVSGDELPENDFEEIENVDGEPVIRDKTTNLYWQKDTKEGFNDPWRQGLSYCENLVYGGYDDWRMPNVNELLSIVDYTVDYTEMVDEYHGRRTVSSFFEPRINEFDGLSSTTFEYSNSYHSVFFNNGRSYYRGKYNDGHVRCVRSDQCDAGTFWDGKNCAVSPCATDSCTMDHSDGICTPKNSSEFECGCVEGFRWNGSDCISDPCFDNKCAAMRGSDGVCTAKENGKFECGCTEGYFWSISSCRKKSALGSICTGMTECYGNSGIITCPSEGQAFYGQDANYAAKDACVGKSFTPATFSGEDVVIDNNTGLMWQKDVSNETYTFNNAVGYCSDLEYAGYTDWRLPSMMELQSILEFGDKRPIDNYYFPTVESYHMWSSVSYSSLRTDAFAVLLKNYTKTPDSDHWPKTEKFNVRCVRGDTMKSNVVTWTENGKRILVDTESGLMLNPNWIDVVTWEEVLYSCENSDYAGYTDWRIGNLNEMLAFTNGKVDRSRSETSTIDSDEPALTLLAESDFRFVRGNITTGHFGGYCVRSGNVPKDFTIEEQINATCSEIVDCLNNCYIFDAWTDNWTDCIDAECLNNSAKDAKYRYQDLYTCVRENSFNEGLCPSSQFESERTRNNCLLSACATEFTTCFANSGEGPHCLSHEYFSSNTDICYSAESVDMNETCFDLTQCMDSCGNDYNCQMACQYYSAGDAQTRYTQINYHYEECAGTADFEGCMLYYDPSLYVNCYGTVDTSCSTLSDCMDSCNDQACKDRCRFNATETGNARYNALLQCRSDNNCGDDDPRHGDCTWNNCGFEAGACYNGNSITCGEFTACLNQCADDDDSCRQACRERLISSEVETQYNDLQECYSNFEESCNKESDPFGCLLDSCRTQYLMCFGYLYSGGFNDTCSDVEACLLSCNNYKCQQGCYANADPEAVTLLNNKNSCDYNNGCYNYYNNGDYQGYFDCINTYCQNEYNACTASSSDFNTSCEEIIQCQDSCGSDINCSMACLTNATLDASADYYNLANCYNNCQNSSGDFTVCIQTNCSSEYAVCGIDVSSLSSNMDCGELSTCVYNCNNDSSCIQTCYNNASLDGATQYDELNQCVANNNDLCQNEANPSDCLIAACQTEYNTCYGGGGSSGGTCDEYTATDISCLQIFNECAYSCNDYNVCIQKGTPEAQTLAQNYLDCAYDCASTQDYDACYSANCMDEAQACENN